MEARENIFRRVFASADAVGNTDAVIGAAGEGEGRELLQCRFNSFHPCFVADVILRHGVWVAPDAREKRLGA